MFWTTHDHQGLYATQLYFELQQYCAVRQCKAGFRQALWMPYVSNIRNPRLMKALRASVVSNPRCTLLENTEVTGFDVREGHVQSVNASSDGNIHKLQAAHFVVTAGAWTGRLLAEAGLPQLPVVPVKGQMVLYQAEKPLGADTNSS